MFLFPTGQQQMNVTETITGRGKVRLVCGKSLSWLVLARAVFV